MSLVKWVYTLIVVLLVLVACGPLPPRPVPTPSPEDHCYRVIQRDGRSVTDHERAFYLKCLQILRASCDDPPVGG